MLTQYHLITCFPLGIVQTIGHKQPIKLKRNVQFRVCGIKHSWTTVIAATIELTLISRQVKGIGDSAMIPFV